MTNKTHNPIDLGKLASDVPDSRKRAARLRESAMVFIIGVSLMHYVYSASVNVQDQQRGVPGNDSYYHIKMAVLFPECGLLQEFPWLRFTYFTAEGRGFVSHHYGFHLLLSPFVHLSHAITGDYLPGARWAMAMFFGISLALFNAVLMTAGIRWRWIYLLLFVLMPFQFFIRHAYVRAISPSLALMLLIVLLMFWRRAVALSVTVALYIHLYLGAVLYAPLIVGTYVFASIAGPKEDRSMPWRLLLAAAIGWSVGVATHPYASGMAEFLRVQVLGSGLSPDIEVGTEWRPYAGTWWFAQMAGVTLTTWVIALCLRLRWGGAINARELTLMLLHFSFLTLTLKARRFIEYWPVFALLSAALLASPIINRLANECDRLLDRKRSGRAVRWRAIGAALVVLAIVPAVLWAPPWREITKTGKGKYDLPAAREAMVFLAEQSDPGDVVFTDDWDIFPLYFYFNHHNHYIVGLDPKFTHARDPVLWERYVKISRGQTPTTATVMLSTSKEEASTKQVKVSLADIRDHFGAAFVVTDRDHKALASRLAADADLAELLYPATTYAEVRDEPYLVFRILQGE